MPGDSARDKKTLQEVDALELLKRILNEEDPLDVNTVYTTEFICLGCNARKKPIALKPEMKLSPHFRLQDEHESGCDVDGYEQLIKKARKGSVSSERGFPVSYPNKLRLPVLRKVTNSNTSQISSTNEYDDNSTLDTSEYQETGKNHDSTVTTIRRLVTHFTSFTHTNDRSLRLSVPGVEVKTYAEVFQKPRYQPTFYYNQTRIYFGKLFYNGILICNEGVRLPLTEGRWENKKPVENLYLEIDTRSWSKAQRQVFGREIQFYTEQIKEQRSSDSKAQLWLFFLGQQNQDNNRKFRLLIEDYRLICFYISSCLQENYSNISIPCN